MNLKLSLKSLIPTILVVFMASCLTTVRPVGESGLATDQQKWIEKTIKK